MANLLDIHVEAIDADRRSPEFDRVAMVDVQPHYFGGLIDRVDLVIDHHPEQPGYTAVFKDIRADYGSTSTILTEHLRAVDVNISERTATAMLYAIKSDTLFFNRQANRVDLEAFSYLYPLADAALIRKMEGAEITLERLELRDEGAPGRQLVGPGLLRVPRRHRRARTSSPTSPTSSCSSRTSSGPSSPASSTTRWSMSVRNLGYSKNAGRVRAAVLRRHRQRRRPSRDGQGGRADAARSGERFGELPGDGRSTARLQEMRRAVPAPTRRRT